MPTMSVTKNHFSSVSTWLNYRSLIVLLNSELWSAGATLLRELKKLDDKILLVEVQLMESQVYYRVGNLQKSRAALTSSRTTANSIYCPPRLQAALDLLSGDFQS